MALLVINSALCCAENYYREGEAYKQPEANQDDEQNHDLCSNQRKHCRMRINEDTYTIKMLIARQSSTP